MANDSLSALLDGELTGPELDRLLDEFEHSPELGRQWSRLCVSREAADGTRVTKSQPCICAAVMAGLDAAPAKADDKVVDLAVRRASRSGSRLKGFWKPAMGFAAAASMGAAAVFLVRPDHGGSEAGVVAVRDDAGSGFLDASYNVARAPSTQKVLLTDDDAYSQMMREYFVEHSNSVEGMGGTLFYTRLAAHRAEYQGRPLDERAQ